MEELLSPDSRVRFQRQDNIAIVTLARPEARNAIDPAMDSALRQVWSRFADDDSLDVAVWTGQGTAFCAGADRDTWFDQWLSARPADVRRNAQSVGFGGLTRGLHRTDKPVIAAINGWTLGGGLELALACDIRIASDRARFGSPLVGLGFHHGDGGISRLLDVCGLGVALDVELSGDPIDAERALAWGLVTRVVLHDALLDEALALARRIAGHDRRAVRSAKETALDVIGRPLDEQLQREALNAYSLEGASVAEGIRIHRAGEPPCTSG